MQADWPGEKTQQKIRPRIAPRTAAGIPVRGGAVLSPFGENGLRVTAVEDARQLKEFIRVPWGIYREDPHWVPPLLIERKQALAAKNPYFQHARWRAWVAHRGGAAIGRISAQVDQLHLDRYRDATGFFGLVEAPDDDAVFRALFDVAEEWLRGQGMRRVIGPFNLGINQEIGILVEGFDTPPYVMMSHSRRYYDQAIQRSGYRPVQDCLAYEIDRQSFALSPKVRRMLERTAPGVRVRPLERRRLDEDIAIMRDIFNDAWTENWSFVPFTQAEFESVAKELLALLPDDFIQIAEVDGEPAAFIVLLPNINEAIADLDGRLLPFGWAKLLWRLKIRRPQTARVPLMGVRQRYQKTRLGPALALLLIQALHQPGLREGLQRVELSWILEQNHDVRGIIENVGGTVTKRYRIYEKHLG